MLQACEKLPLWLRESDPMAEIAEIFLRSLPRREYNPSPYVTINNFLLLFHSNLIRHIRKQIKDQERRQTIRQTFKETDITVDVLPDYLLLDFLQQQEPWLRQYALQRYLGLTQEEIAELCHLTKRTLIKDEKRLCRLLKKRQFSK
jgi:DNA-directed RNA polymerase specialized sigma24 family protein